jgi:hypothetical protein
MIALRWEEAWIQSEECGCAGRDTQEGCSHRRGRTSGSPAANEALERREDGSFWLIPAGLAGEISHERAISCEHAMRWLVFNDCEAPLDLAPLAEWLRPELEQQRPLFEQSAARGQRASLEAFEG